MSLLPQPATISYGTPPARISFNDPSTETLDLTASARYDSAQRTVIYVEYDITIKTIVSVDNLFVGPTTVQPSGVYDGVNKVFTVPTGSVIGGVVLNGAMQREGVDYTLSGAAITFATAPPANAAILVTLLGSTDNFMVQARRILLAPGRAFVYKDNGFGPLEINAPPESMARTKPGPGPRDVIWGPKPQILKWKPQGAQQACEIVWRVQVAIPECDNARFDGADNWMEMCYRMAYAVDKSGYTTRTYSGFVRVPQTRASADSRVLRFSADEAREKIYPALVPGFRRIPGTFTLSEDKCRLDFSVVDEQAPPNLPPPGVIEASADHSLTTQSVFSSLWNGTLSATYELSRSVSRDGALKHFRDLIADRLQDKAGVVGVRVPLLGFVNVPLTRAIILKSLTISDPEIHGRKAARFQLTYVQISMTIADIAALSGLWREVPDNNWAKWSASLQRDWGPRGHANLLYNAADDMLVDLCLPAQPKPGPGGNQPDPKKVPGSEPLRNKVPPASSSWFHWRAWVRIVQLDEPVQLKPLLLQPIQPPEFRDGDRQPGKLHINMPGLIGGDPPLGPGPGPLDNAAAPPPDITLPPLGGVRAANEAGAKPVIQIRAEPTYIAYFMGEAVRAGHTIPRPTLRSVGGQETVPQNRWSDSFDHSEIAVWFGLPIYGATWCLRYLLRGKPGEQVRQPENPFEERMR